MNKRDKGGGRVGIYPTRSCGEQGLTRRCRVLLVELNIAEPLLVSTENWRLEMVKLSVNIFRLCPIATRRDGRDGY